ncbi:hypothetical protein DPEC_G00263350 [Dallia pectoralis]|uniref:Uncharacterized protein n=1 Tax=Dallia pectoralis TaxID=75939 RepID=A0ACC2FSA2_DALPE|nr:hypothetical protein DPEC_G00263350 [Dallia pectoralis]
MPSAHHPNTYIGQLDVQLWGTLVTLRGVRCFGWQGEPGFICMDGRGGVHESGIWLSVPEGGRRLSREVLFKLSSPLEKFGTGPDAPTDQMDSHSQSS